MSPRGDLRKFLAGLALVWGLALAGAALAAQATGLEVATGIPPLGYLLERLAGPADHVQVLVGSWQNHHTYEPTPRQRASLARAKVYFKLGLPFENALLDKLTGDGGGPRVVDLTQGLDLAPAPEGEHQPGEENHDEGELDLHIWLSPRLAQGLAARMAQTLAELDPAGAAAYQQRLKALVAELRQVDQRLGQVLAPYQGAAFLVYHPAFGYLGRDYGLKQVAVETDGKEPGARHLAAIIQKARQEGIKVVFVQPQFPHKIAQQVAREIGGAVVVMDDLAPDYLANLERLAQSLEQGLNGRGKP